MGVEITRTIIKTNLKLKSVSRSDCIEKERMRNYKTLLNCMK